MVKDKILKKVAGEIVLSKNPGEEMKKWREIFGIQQIELAQYLDISPSVISDYEGGRRKSPGSQIIKRFVESLIEIDLRKGGEKVRELSKIFSPDLLTGILLDIEEFTRPVKIKEICVALDGDIVASKNLIEEYVYGYSIIDSIEAIKRLSGGDFLRLYGLTTRRVIVFTKVTTGRSPMVAIKVRDLRPAAVVLHNPRTIDKLAIELAEIVRIPLIVTMIKDVEEVISRMKSLSK